MPKGNGGNNGGADATLLFGVAGGGDIGGETGSLIKSQLDSIIRAINKKPFEIKVKLDTKDLDKIKQIKGTGMKQVASHAKEVGKESKRAATQVRNLQEETKKLVNAQRVSPSKRGNSVSKDIKNQISQVRALDKEYKSFVSSKAKARWELKELGRTRSGLMNDARSVKKNSIPEEAKRVSLLTKNVSALGEAMEQVISVDKGFVSKDQRKAISGGVSYIKSEIKDLKEADKLRTEASKKASIRPTRLMQDLKSMRKELEQNMTVLNKSEDGDFTAGRLKARNKLQLDYNAMREKFIALDSKVIAQNEKNVNNIIKETQAMKTRSAALVEYVENRKQLTALREKSKADKRQSRVDREIGDIKDTKNLLKKRFSELSNINKADLTPVKLEKYKQAQKDFRKYQENVTGLDKGRIASTNENITAIRREGNALKETTRQILAYNKAKAQRVKAKQQEQYNKERPKIEQELKDLKAQESNINKSMKILDDNADTSKTQAEIDALKKLKQAQRDYNVEVQGASKGYTKQTHENIADIYKRGEALQKEAASWVEVKNARVEAAKADVKGNELVEKGLPALKKNLADTERLLTTKIDNSTAAKKSHDSQIRGWYKDLVAYKNQVKALRAEAESLGKDNQLGGVDKANKFNRITADLSKLKSETSGVMANLHDAGKDVKAFGSGFGGLAKKFASWLSVSQVVMAAYNGMKRMVVAVRDVDTAMTELKKVTDETDASYDQFLEKSVSRSKQLGASLSDTISASADFARLGYSLSEASDLADAAMIYKNVGDGIGSVEEASSSIISTMKAFGIETSDVMSIVDKFNAVGNNFAISSKGIGDALLRSASSLASANNTLDESIALITAANATVQDTDKVGTSLKTVSMFLRAAKTEAIDAGESTEGMAESVSKLRQEFLDLTGGKVDIQLDDDTFKSTYQIIKEIAGVWDELTDITQANILERMGGKRNSNVVASMIENFQIAEDVMKTAGNSAGSALAENEKYLDSINGKVAQFKATFEEVSVDLIDSESVKLVIDMGTGLLNIVGIVAQLVSALGGLKNILGAIAAYKAGKNLFELGKHLKVALNAINSAGSTKLVPYGQHVGKVSAVLGEMSNSMDKVGKSASKMKIAMTALGSIGTIIGIIATAYYSQKERINAENQKAASNAELLSKDLATLDSYKQRASALQDSLNTGNLSMQEAYNARKELVGIQQELVDMYGQEAQGIDLVTGKINGQIAALSQSGWEQFKHENSDAINRATNFFNGFNMGDAVKGIDKLWARDGSLQIYIPEYSSKGTNITEQLKKAGERNADAAVDSFYSEIESGLKSLDITIPDNALGIKNIGSFSISDENFNSPYEALHFYEQLYDIMDKAGRVSFGKDYNNYIGETLSQYSEIISNIKNQIGDYEPIFNQYAEGLLASDDIYSDIWGKALAARQKYDDAVLSGDQAAIDSAIIEMKDIETAFSNSNSKWDASAKLYAERFFNAFAEETAQRQVEINIKAKVDNGEFDEEIKSEIANFTSKTGLEVSSDLAEKDAQGALDGAKQAYQEYIDLVNEARGKGFDLNQTVFGNIDTNTREKLEWTTENLRKYKSELMSMYQGEDWKDIVSGLKGSYSTIFGSSSEFDGVEIAFTPLLQTGEGEPKLLNAKTVQDYIYSIIDKAKADDGKFSKNEILKFDAEGLEINGTRIKGLIADVGETAIATGEAMHYMGDTGAIADAWARVQEMAESAGTTTGKLVDYFKKTDGLSVLLDPFTDKNTGMVDMANVLNGQFSENKKIKASYDSLNNIAAKYNTTVEGLLVTLSGLGYITLTTSDATNELTAEYDRLESKVSEISASSDVMSKALAEQSKTGVLSLDTYKSLVALGDDYTDCLEWNGKSLAINEDKMNSLNESMIEATKAEIELARAQDVQKWNENRAEIEKLITTTDEWDDATLGTLNTLKATNEQLASNIEQYGILASQLDFATSGYKKWMDAQSAPTTGQAFNGVQGAVADLEEGFKTSKLNTPKYKAALDFVIPEEIQEDGVDAVRQYVAKLNEIVGKEAGVQGMLTFLDKAVNQELMEFVDNEYRVKEGITTDDFAKKLTMTRDVVLAIFGELEEYDDFHFSFVDEDPTAALQSIQKLLDAKAELINAEHQYGKDSDEYRDAQEDVNKYAEAVNNLPDSVKTEVGLETDEELTPENISEQLSDIDPVTISAELRYDVEKNDIQKQIEDYRHAFAEMQDAAKQKIDVTPYAEKVNAIRQQLEALPPAVQAAFNIDTTLFDHGIASISETIEDYKVALANLGKAEPDTSAYTEAEAKVEELRGAIEELPEEVRIAAGIDLETLDAEIENDTFELKISPVVAEADTSQILLDIATAEERISALESTPIALTADITDVTTKLGEIEQKIQGLAESLNINLDVNTTWTPNATPGNTKLPSLEPVSTTATVDTSQAMTAIETLKAAIASVKDKLVKVIAKVSGIQSVNALRNSIANTHGKTVVIRTIHRDEYQASGVQQFNGTDGPSKESGIFLGGEVGRELVVDPRSGTWHTIGDRGAEFFSLRKGQIVFNAKQTEQLLSSGRTLGRGRVMVNGNAGNAAVGGAGNPIIVGGLGQPSYDSTHANKVVNKIKDTIKDISKDVGKETGDAAKKTEEAFKKMIASVEHEIFLMEKNHADPQEIIKVYQNLQKSVHDMAEQYRAKGEQANAEHIEELQKQWWKYADAIESIRKETFEKMTSRAEHEIFLMEKNNADPRDIIKIYQGLQEATHDMAEGYRARGEEENAEHIEELQKQWWEYAEAIEDVRKKTIDEFVDDADFMVEALEKNDSSVDRITNTYSAALKVIQGEIDHYISNGYDITDEVVQDLLHKIWEVEDNAQSALHKAVDKANEAVGDVLNVYDTLNGAADEYAEFGFITVERLQDIIGLGVEYMAFLQDENGQLVINKESIQNVVAARAEQLAVESALSYVEQLRLALDQGNEIELQRLLTATTTATNATWGLVYANLALLDLNGDQFAAALHNINALRSLADNAISNVSHSIGGLHKQEAARRDESLHKQKDALDKLLDYVMELVKWEAEHKIEALEEQIDDYRKIIDLKKESLRATKDELDYEDELKDRVSKIADLQARIAILALDDSRSAQQERIKLEEQLAEAQKEVADKQSDHMLEKHEDALDDMADAYEKEKQKEIDAVKETISSTEKIYRLAIDRINNHWDTLYKDLINYNYEYGSHIEKDIIEAWNNASEAVKKYGGYLEAVSRIESEIKHSESIKNNEGMNSIIGGSTQHDTSGINENTAKLIVERMKANSVAYSGSNNNPEMQQSLADENVKLASKLSELLGANVVRDENGVWFIDGERLYDKYSALGGYNANPGQELANPQYSVAKAMVDKMKENGAKWATYAGDKAMQDKLAQENEKLAQRLSEYLGVEIKKDGNGVWLINGEKLFDKYHTGGIVGHRSSLRQDEMMAVLQKGEAVLDKRKENAVIRLMDFANNISKKIDAVAGRFRIEDINRIDMAGNFDTKRPNINESNRCVSINFGDVNITGTDKETIAEHKRINRKFTNEILEQLKIRK